MFKMLSNIFERSDSKQPELPRALLTAAIERTVDGTDPRLRMMPGYAKKLRRSVVHAVEHVIQLVDSLPAPLPLSSEDLANHPALAVVFHSSKRLQRVISQDEDLTDRLKQAPQASDPVTALLVLEKEERKRFGVALVNGKMRKDVAQTTINFTQHRLLDPTFSDEETRRLLKRRAFDRLLVVALSHLSERREERESLASRKAVLRCKLDIVRRSSGFQDQADTAEQSVLQERLEAVEQQLSALGPDEGVLPANLATVAEVLGNAERHLWVEDVSLCVDRQYVLHHRPGPKVPAITFQEIHDSENNQALVLMVALKRAVP